MISLLLRMWPRAEGICQFGGVAEFIERRPDRLAARQARAANSSRRSSRWSRSSVGDFVAAARFEPQEPAQQ